MTTVVISQPMYFPWPGFMAQMAMADVYVWLDHVQFVRGGFMNRIQIKNGVKRSWITIPIKSTGARQRIVDLEAEGSDWKRDHANVLQRSLGSNRFFKEVLDLFEGATSEATIADCLIKSSELLARQAGLLPKNIFRSSEMNLTSTSWRLILDLVKRFDGTVYLTGHGARDYTDHNAFEREGVEVRYMDYKVEPWPQSGEFTPFVSSLDLYSSVGNDFRSFLNPSSKSWRDHLRSLNPDHR